MSLETFTINNALFYCLSLVSLFAAMQVSAATSNVKLESATLINNKTGQSFTDSLVTNLANDLSDISQGKKKPKFAYFSEDVAAVEAIGSLQEALFDLSAYFAANTQGFNVNKYLPGVALEYATTRCDTIASTKYPRSWNALPSPWNNYGDSVYYQANCRSNTSDIRGNQYETLLRRSRRDLFFQKLKPWFGSRFLESRKRRQMRSIIIDPSRCGAGTVLKAISGNISSPGYPGNYSSQLNCVWYIEVPVKYAVKIDVEVFDLEYDRKCLFDKVEFFDGAESNARSLGRFCGTIKPSGIRSSRNILAIRMKTDSSVENRGFLFRWSLTKPSPPHPGFIITANIIVDQLGMPPASLKTFSFIFKDPKTCGLESKDTYCYFQYKKMIISKIIATTTLPAVNMEGQFVEVVFDHVIDLKSFPSLYNSKKFCMRWNTTIPGTDNGVWSRYGASMYKTNQFQTICHYDKPGIYAILAEVLFADDPVLFSFTGTFHASIIFGIIWSFVLLGQWAHSRRINVPEWLNFNQVVALLLFLGTVFSGLYLHYEKGICSFVSFLLYYFGLSVFVWQFLKAAQLTGKFDDFFAKGRNIYLFYFLLGWTIPMFIAGMAAGAVFYQREESQSCWLALVGGTIWGYTSPTYFVVLMNLILLYKVSKKTRKNIERYNHPELRKRTAREAVQILLFVATWVFGILCVIHKTSFLMQYFFCIALTLSVLLLSLSAKQRRPGYQKIHYVSLVEEPRITQPLIQDSNDNHEQELVDDEDDRKQRIRKMLSMRAYRKWRKFKRSELKLEKSSLTLKKYNSAFKMQRLEEQGSESTLKSPTSNRGDSSNDSAESDSNSDLFSDEDQPSTRAVSEKMDSSIAENRGIIDETAPDYTANYQKIEEEIGVDNNLAAHDDENFANNDLTKTRETEDVQPTDHNNEDESGFPKTSQEDLHNSTEEDNTEEIAGNSDEEFKITGEGEENIVDEEEPLSNENDIEGGDEFKEKWEKEKSFGIPVITMNAFGGSPNENDVELPTRANLSHAPSRVLSTRPEVEPDSISVTSLDDNDEPVEADNEDGNANNEEDDLYDISMFK